MKLVGRDALGNPIVLGCPFPLWCPFTKGPTHKHSLILPEHQLRVLAPEEIRDAR